MESLLKSARLEVRLLSTGSPVYSKLSGRGESCHKTSKMPTLYKNKGEKAACDNYIGIFLLSITGKIQACILLNRIPDHIVDSMVTKSQCDFRQNRDTVDMAFAVRQLEEKCVEQPQDMYLAKAFDTVCRPGLLSILSKLG